jgi:Cu2+-containing amine oxidase
MGDFYAWASGESVTLVAARYDYGVNWAIYTDGTFTHWNVS